jgi:hypothetical protein
VRAGVAKETADTLVACLYGVDAAGDGVAEVIYEVSQEADAEVVHGVGIELGTIAGRASLAATREVQGGRAAGDERAPACNFPAVGAPTDPIALGQAHRDVAFCALRRVALQTAVEEVAAAGALAAGIDVEGGAEAELAGTAVAAGLAVGEPRNAALAKIAAVNEIGGDAQQALACRQGDVDQAGEAERDEVGAGLANVGEPHVDPRVVAEGAHQAAAALLAVLEHFRAELAVRSVPEVGGTAGLADGKGETGGAVG